MAEVDKGVTGHLSLGQLSPEPHEKVWHTYSLSLSSEEHTKNAHIQAVEMI